MRARSGWRKTLPDGGDRPARALEVDARAARDGRATCSSSPVRKRVRNSYQGKPSASSIAGARTSASESVPNSASAMARASTTAGTVPASGPLGGISPQAAEVLGRRGGRRRSLAVDDDDLPPVGEVEDDRHLAAEAEVRDLGDRGREGGGHAGVDGVAAAGEHAHARLGREVPAGRDDADPAEDFRPVGVRAPDLLGMRGAEAEAGGGDQSADGGDPVQRAEPVHGRVSGALSTSRPRRRGSSPFPGQIAGYCCSCVPNCIVPLKERTQTPSTSVQTGWLMSLNTRG